MTVAISLILILSLYGLAQKAISKGEEGVNNFTERSKSDNGFIDYEKPEKTASIEVEDKSLTLERLQAL